MLGAFRRIRERTTSLLTKPTQPPQPTQPTQPSLPASPLPLPTELFQLIFQHLIEPPPVFAPSVSKWRSILPLMVVSQGFRDQIEYTLYRSINIGPTLPLESRFQLFEHLANCPRVALLVRAFVHHGPTEQIGYFEVHSPRYWKALNATLRALTGLAKLNLELFGMADYTADVPTDRVLDGCKFILESLELSHPSEEDTEFIRTQQPHLDDLGISFADDQAVFQMTFPRATTLSIVGTEFDIASQEIIGPGVRCLSLNGEHIRVLPPTPLQPFSQITSLQLTLCTTHTLKTIPILFPSLKYLHISFAAYQTEIEGSISSSSRQTSLLATIPLLTTLRHLRITRLMMRIEPPEPMDTPANPAWRELRQLLFKRMRGLDRVVMEMGGRPEIVIEYGRGDDKGVPWGWAKVERRREEWKAGW